jgi:flagellar biosynthesis protein
MKPNKKTLQEKSKKLKRRIEDLSIADKRKVRAIAVKYEPGKKKAPKIVATGRGKVAEQILQLAEDNRIPMFEDQALTDLLSKLDLDMEIPPELYTLVAEVLAFVYQLNSLAKKKRKQ